MNRLLITGAAGKLGQLARRRLTGLAKILRVSDISSISAISDFEEIMPCDLGNAEVVGELVADCDGIVHLGAISEEDCFDRIIDANIRGVYNLYEAVRRQRQCRIFLASSNHVVGFYRQDQRLDARAVPRPDGLYGVSKCFAENLASLYFDKFGIETAIVRIGTCVAEPRDHRMLATWFSEDDFISLVEHVFALPRLGCPIIYGVSANDARWWDNRHAEHLGWRARDNAEIYRDKLNAELGKPDPDADVSRYQGGVFTSDPIYLTPRDN